MKAIISVVGLAAFLMACSGGAANMNVSHASSGALAAPGGQATEITAGKVGALPAWTGPSEKSELHIGSAGAMPAWSGESSSSTVAAAR